MQENLSWSVIADQENDGEDLTPLASQWASGVNVRISYPAKVIPGPVQVLANELEDILMPLSQASRRIEYGSDRCVTFG